jgi:hypothetical protein
MTIPPAMRERLKDLIPAGLPAERRPDDQPACGQPTIGRREGAREMRKAPAGGAGANPRSRTTPRRKPVE